MQITTKTKIVARLHPEENGRALSIYNPYFEKTHTDAVYMLFQNANIAEALDGMKKLKITGAISAGFEHDPQLPPLLDEIDPAIARVGRIGTITNRGGKLKGYYFPGYALSRTIQEISPIKNKRVVVLGAGTVVRCFLSYLASINELPSSVEIYNRTYEHAVALEKEYPIIKKIGTLANFEQSSGDIFINSTFIGSHFNEGENIEFDPAFLSKFSCIADTTFIPIRPHVMDAAEKAGVPIATGAKMFAYQGAKSLETILGEKIDVPLLYELILQDFQKNWI
jgi:shikimate dehydrogenase